MKWTTDLPTEAGWYWAWPGDRTKPEVVQILECGESEGLMVWQVFSKNEQPLSWYASKWINRPTRFCGPLKPPEGE